MSPMTTMLYVGAAAGGAATVAAGATVRVTTGADTVAGTVAAGVVEAEHCLETDQCGIGSFRNRK